MTWPEEGADTPAVRAAGGVVHRSSARGPEVLCVHRPRHEDWSFPKGKLDPGESWEEAARREVAEETGLRCRLGSELRPVAYRDQHGRPKLVRYWLMAAEGEGEREEGEVDELRWVTFPEARSLLTYERDRGLVHEAAVLLGEGAGRPG